MRVAVYSIALNEIQHVDRFLCACTGADTILAADTGSTDGTPDALRNGGAATYAITVRPWRFDDARNAALALVPPEIDVCIALDLDEVLSPGWRDALENGWTPDTTSGRYRYVATHLPNGAPAVVMAGAKIHTRFGYRWRHMCHEILVPDRISHPRETWLPNLQVDHWPDLSKSRSDYLSLLEAAVSEGPNEPRDLFLLGRDYVALGRWDEGEAMLRRYLKAAANRWPQQRAAAWRRLARCREANGDAGAAIACLLEGLHIAQDSRDLWLDLADLHARRKDWQASYEAAMHGLALPTSPGAIANDHANAGGRPFYRASCVAAQLGLLKQAYTLATQANAQEAGNPVFRQHLDEVRKRYQALAPQAEAAAPDESEIFDSGQHH